MVRVLFSDHKVMNPVRRGEANERMVRPSDEKFLDNTNFKIGKFRPLSTNYYNDNMGGGWLGKKYMKKIGNEKPLIPKVFLRQFTK